MRPNTLGGRETRCTLISRSCTTSWFDWIHGELWLCDDGLFRRSLGLIATIKHGARQTVDPGNRATRNFLQNEISDIVAQGRRNRWIPWTDIQHATLKRGVVDNSLHVDLKHDRHEKFLWLAIDQGYEFLETELRAPLAGRLTVLDGRVG
jgi:hypothetical protein